MTLMFTVGGLQYSAAELQRLAPKRKAKSSAEVHKATTDRSQAKQSLGFQVEGYSPEMLEAAEAAHARTRAAYMDLKALGKLGQNEKDPGEWDADKWMSSHKPKRVRTKPFEIASSADQCAELARKAGWLHVTVSELLRT